LCVGFSVRPLGGHHLFITSWYRLICRLISSLNSYRKTILIFNPHEVLIRHHQTWYLSQACTQSRTLCTQHHSPTIYSTLYRIQGDIIRDIYNHNVISAHPLRLDELFSKIIHLDHDLIQWKRKLHPDSALLPLESIGDMDVENWAYTKIQTVLTLRFLNVRALLFRKVLEHFLHRIGKPSDVSNDIECSLPIGETMIQACTDSCIQTITIIHSIGARPELLPAWWYTAYYGVYEREKNQTWLLIEETVFNSALILFGVICLQILKDADVQTRPAAELVVCLQTGLEALDVVGKETRIVRRCSKYLRKIIQVATLLGELNSKVRRKAKHWLLLQSETMLLDGNYPKMLQQFPICHPKKLYLRCLMEARIPHCSPNLVNSWSTKIILS
jgi:hypothetical protein